MREIKLLILFPCLYKYRFIEISTGKEIPDLKAYREALENKEKFEMNM